MKKIFLIVTLAIGLASCKKQETATTRTSTKTSGFDPLTSLFATQVNTYGSLHYGYHQVGFGSTTNGYFQLGGDFFSDTPNTTLIDIGQISFSSNTYTHSTSMIPSYKFTTTQATDYLMNGGNFGGNHTFTFAGNINFPSTTVTLYNPTRLNVTSNITNSHSKLNNITLAWNSDLSNPNGKIYIIINYQAGPSVRESALNPSSASSIEIETDDDGAHTINSSVLTSLPSNSIWTINIIRYNETIETISSKPYQFVTYSAIEKEFMLLP